MTTTDSPAIERHVVSARLLFGSKADADAAMCLLDTLDLHGLLGYEVTTEAR